MAFTACEKRLVLAASCLAIFVNPLIGTMLNLALPAIGADLGASAHQQGWITSVYFIVSVIFLMPAARLADIFGKKRIFMFGAAFAIVSLLLCAAAPNLIMLYIFRGELVSLYTPDAAVQKLAASLLIFGVIYHVTDACQSVSNFALRGYRVTVLPMIMYGVLLWCVGLGGGYYLGFYAESFGGPYGATGFWAATSVGLFLAGISLSALALYVSHVRASEDRRH